MFAEYSMYLLMRGFAIMYFILDGISNNLHLFFIPSIFIFGDIARHIVPFPLLSSATTRFVVNGSRFLSTHSTDA